MENVYVLSKEPTGLRPVDGIIKANHYLDFVRAEEMINRATERAQEIITCAKQQADQIITRAETTYQQEKERGYREGLEKGQAEISGQITATVAETTHYLDKMAGKMVELTMRMLKTILGKIDNRELVEKIVFKTMKGVRDEGRIMIRVHPECVDHVKDKITAYAMETGRQDLFDVIGEPRLDKHGCVLESEIGYVDSSLNTQLKAIRESFEKSIKKHQIANHQDLHEEL
jgi:type III secretion protein L